MTAIWNDKLITRGRAADMCGLWDIKLDHHDKGIVFFRCHICDGNITRLPSDGKLTSIDALIAAVLRHMCSSHGYSLSGAGNDEGKGSDGAAAHGPGGGGGGGRAGDLVR